MFVRMFEKRKRRRRRLAGPGGKAGNLTERFTPWGAWGEGVPTALKCGFDAVKGVYRLVITLQGE
jgi:hypothetical protein